MAEFPTLADIFEPVEGKSGTETNKQMRLWYTGTRQLPGATPSEAITIVDDVITPTSADIIVDTEGQAPADDLQIIKTGSTHDGMILSLRAANPDRVVTIIATGQLNGITLWGRAERYVLSTTEQLVLQRGGNMWREIRKITPFANDSELTLDNTEMAVRASQMASMLSRTKTLEEAITALKGTVSAIRVHDVGDIQLKPFRYNELPFGWYFANGDNYVLASVVGAVLNALPANYKTDWGITVSGSSISLPNMFYTDGRGYFLRSANGTTRKVRSVETDAIQNISGYIQNKNDGVFYADQSNGAFYSGGNVGTRGYGGGGDCTNIFYFDASRQVRTAAENRPLNVGMTPAIYLGV